MCMKLVCMCFVMCDVWVLVLCLGVSCCPRWLITFFPVLLRAASVYLCLLVVPLFCDFAGVDGCIGKFNLVPRAVVVGPEAETCGVVVAVTGNETWE